MWADALPCARCPCGASSWAFWPATPRTTRARVRPHQRDRARAIDVSIAAEAAAGVDAAEVLTGALADVEAPMTGLAAVGGVDQHQGHTGRQRLVGEEAAQLVKSPAVSAPALGLRARLAV